MVLSPAAARRRHAAAAASFLPSPLSPVRSPAEGAAVQLGVPGAEFDAELSALASTMLSQDVVPAAKLTDKAGTFEAVSAVAEDARYRGRLDERQESVALAQQQTELHTAELKAMQVKAELEAESMKLQAKLDALKAAADARQDAEEREEAYRQRAEAERKLRQEAEAQALEARKRAEQLETQQKEAEHRRREAERSAGEQLRDQKRQLAAVEARLQEDAAEEQRWKEHVAALRIQGVERVRQARREVERLAYEQRREVKRLRNAAATKIQAVYRGHLIRVRNPSALASAMGADTPFQNARSPFARAGSLFQHAVERQWRGGSVTTARWKEAARWQGEEVHATWQEAALETALIRGSAALRIQSHFRGWAARQHQAARQRSTLVIQRIFRGWATRNHLRRIAAAIVIQGVFRGRLVRRWLGVEVVAATAIQAHWRGWLLRDQRKVAFRAATTIQAAFRSWMVRVWMCTRAEAATVLQAAARGVAVRKNQRVQAAAAVDIQRTFRGWQLRRALDQEQRAATYIQAMWRGFSYRQWLVWNINAANTITAAWRGYVLRSEMRRWRDSVLRIQRAWRGRAARKELASQLHAVTELQRVQRGRLARRMMHRRFRSAVVLQALVRARFVQDYLFEQVAAARMIQAMVRGHLVRSQIKREIKAAQMIQAAQRGRAEREAMAALYRAAARIQATFRGWVARRELCLQMDCAVVLQAVCRAHLEMRARWTEDDAATLIQRIWRGFQARQEAKRLRLAKERYRAAQLAEFDRMRTELEAEASAESEAAQIARQARMRMAVDAVETVFPRPQDADYDIRARHAMAREILGHDVLESSLSTAEDPSKATVPVATLRNYDPSIPETGQLAIEGLNSGSKLPGVDNLFAVQGEPREALKRPQRRVDRVPRPPATVAAAPAGIGLYSQTSNRAAAAPNLEWSTNEIIDGVTLTTPSGPAGGMTLMQSGALATSMRGRLLRGSLEQLENDAATTIQRCFRGWQARADMLLEWDAMQARHDLETQAATLIQAAHRGLRARRQLQNAWSTPLSSSAELSVMFDFDSELTRGLTLMQASRYTEAVAAFELCHAMRPDASLPPYYLAGCLSAMSDIKNGLKWLDIAVLLGMDINELMRDPDLKKLRYHPELEVHYGSAQLRYEAAVRLQAVARGGLTRAKLEREMWEEVQEEAAVRVQAAVRGWDTRRNLRMEREAEYSYAKMVKLQGFWRGQLCRRKLARQAEAVTTIAAYQRMRVLRRMFVLIQRLALETSGVICIQRIWRGTWLRKEFQSLREQAAAVVAQSAYRGWAARKRLAQEYEHEQHEFAALQIQSIWRGHSKRKDLLRQMRDALDELDREMATRIQAAYRSWAARRRLAAEQRLVKLQAIWRGAMARRKLELELETARLILEREQAATTIQAAFRGWSVRATIEMERCLASLVSMQAIRRGTVARQGVGRMQLRELQERERMEIKLASQRKRSETGLVKLQARQRGRIARRLHPSQRQIEAAALTLQVLLRTIEPREELIARKLRSRAAMESTLSLQAVEEMNYSRESPPRQAVEAVVQVALDITEAAESAATRSLAPLQTSKTPEETFCPPPRPETPPLEPLLAEEWETIVAAEEQSEEQSEHESEHESEQEEVVPETEQEEVVLETEQVPDDKTTGAVPDTQAIVLPTPDPNDWAALAAREQQQNKKKGDLPSVTAGRPPRSGPRKKKQPVGQNPFGPTATLGGGSTAGPATMRQRAKSTPGPVSGVLQLEASAGYDAQGDLPGTWSAEAQRPRTSPDARVSRTTSKSRGSSSSSSGGLRQSVEQNPFGPTASLYGGGSTGSATMIRQRAKSTPGPVSGVLQLEASAGYDAQGDLPGTWSAEAQLPRPSAAEAQRPRTSPDSHQSDVDGAILSWSENLFAPAPVDAVTAGTRTDRPQALSQNPFDAPAGPTSTADRRAQSAGGIGGSVRSRSHPGPSQHLEAAANIKAYLSAAEGDQAHETDFALELTGSMMAQLQGTWSADATQVRASTAVGTSGGSLIYGPRPRTSPERQPRLLPGNPFGSSASTSSSSGAPAPASVKVKKTQRSQSTPGSPVSAMLRLPDPAEQTKGEGGSIDGTWSAEAEAPRAPLARQSSSAADKREQAAKGTLPSLAKGRGHQRPSTSDGGTASKPTAASSNLEPQRRGRGSTRSEHVTPPRGRGRSRSKSRSRGRGQSRGPISRAADSRDNLQQQRQQRQARPETPEQALAMLVSPSELNASLPPRRDRAIDPVEQLGDALAGTWGHISPRSRRGATGGGAGNQQRAARRRRNSGRVVQQRWEPRGDSDEENIPFVKSLAKKYGSPPKDPLPPQKSEEKQEKQQQQQQQQEEEEDAAGSVVLAEISEQERKLMGALGMKHDGRKHVP